MGSFSRALNSVSGAFQSPVVPIPANAIEGLIALTGPSVNDPGVVVSVTFDFSPDGGATWSTTSPGPAMNPFPGVITDAGAVTDGRGNPKTQIGIASPPFPAGTNRQIRAIIIFDGNPFTGTLTASWV